MTGRRITVAISGASGAAYALQLVRTLLAADCRVELVLSAAARQVLKLEQQLDWSGELPQLQRQVQQFFAVDAERLRCYANDDFCAPCASGSNCAAAMVIVPASMGCVARVAAGISANVIERAADVMLKERKPLVLVPRETPLNAIHLENLLSLTRAGAVVLPAMPAFYGRAQRVEDLIDFIVGKICDVIGVPHQLLQRWGEENHECHE